MGVQVPSNDRYKSNSQSLSVESHDVDIFFMLFPELHTDV